MAEVAGLALAIASAVGFLGQVFTGCINAYSIYTTAANLGPDSERFVVRIRIEEARLQVWGEAWGVGEGRLEQTLSANKTPHQEGLRKVAELILTKLYETIMDLGKLQDRYGLREQAPGSVDVEGYKKTCKSPLSLVTGGKGGGRMKLRARWVIADKEKFAVFLEDLKYFNDSLTELFPPERAATIQRAWTNDLVQRAERMDELEMLASASSGGLYPRLNTFAQLKQLRINLDAMEPSKKILSSSELKIPLWRLEVAANGHGTNHNNGHSPGSKSESVSTTRSAAIYQRPLDEMRGAEVSESVDVFVEWSPYEHDPAASSLDDRLHLYQRIDNLARMLHSSSNRHPDLHTLDCLGYVEDSAHSRYGLVYLCPAHYLKPPPATPQTPMFQNLGSIIAELPTPDLNVRFKLAHTLAVALWSCHSLDWLHKTLCPHNVLFFNEPAGATTTGTGVNQSELDRSASPPPYAVLQRSFSSFDNLSSSIGASLGLAVPSPSPGPETSPGPQSHSRPRTPSASNATAAPIQTHLSKPYLAGFDSSRPDHLVEMTVASKNEAGQDLYRHPASLGAFRQTYRKSFDVYSLGLLLLEIGLWKGLEGIHKGKAGRYTPAALRDKIVTLLVPTLGPKAGGAYRDVVARCLTFDDSDKSSSSSGAGAHQLMEWVVMTLGELRV